MRSARRKTMAVVLAQAIAQLSLVVVLPVITRAFPVADVGYYQVAMAIAMTLQPLATLRVEFAIPSLSRERNVRRLIRKATLSLLILSTGLAGIAGIYQVMKQNSIALTLLMSAVMLAGFGWTAIDNSKLIREAQLGRLAARNLTSGLVASSLQLIVALASTSVLYLAIAILVARSMAILVTRTRRDNPTVERVIEDRPYTAKRMAASVSSGVVATITGQVLLFASAIGGPVSASGYVGIAQRVAGAPLTLLGQGLAQIMQSSIGPLVRERRSGIRRKLLRQAIGLSIMAALSSAALIALAPPLAGPILGKGWEPAGIIVAILAIPMSLQLVVGPLMAALPLLGREGLLALTQVARLVLVVGTVSTALILGSDIYGLTVSYSIATLIGYLGMFAVVLLAAQNHDRKWKTVMNKTVMDGSH